MKSTTGQHFIALDHVRAIAAFLVFTWHFIHNIYGHPVPFEYTPSIPYFALLDEGHTGVALFMTLSGYLFAKLLDGKSIRYLSFIWNRMLRLLPLLTVVVIAVGIIHHRDTISEYMHTIMLGMVLPKLPNGGWSIAVEFHYYLLLPLFLWMLSKSNYLLIVVIAIFICIRYLIYHIYGQVHEAAYYSIIGRVDQFALGMMFFGIRHFLRHKHLLVAIIFSVFCVYYWLFDMAGGYYKNPTYPSNSPIWIIMPTLEGLAYGMLIAWYETSFNHSTSGFSAWLGRMGEYSYSIYLLHFFIVFKASAFIHTHIINISNFYLACFCSLLVYIGMMPIGYLSYRLIEAPFLKFRKRYIVT